MKNGIKDSRLRDSEYKSLSAWFNWNEPGMAFRVTFINKNYRQQQELQHELQHELRHESMYGKVLKLVQIKTSSTKELSAALGQKSISGQLKKTLAKLQKNRLIEWTEPDSAKSSKQQYRITQKGMVFLHLLKDND